jgi:hypothetical protein
LIPVGIKILPFCIGTFVGYFYDVIFLVVLPERLFGFFLEFGNVVLFFFNGVNVVLFIFLWV